jgi:hypothetical protein
MAFDPIQVVLGLSGVAAVLVGLTMRANNARQPLGQRLLLLGLGLLGAAVIYSLVLTWTK